jgi:hypothetical protein
VTIRVQKSSTRSVLRSYGYTWQGIRPITWFMSYHILKDGGEVLLLFPDGSEAYSNDYERCLDHFRDGGLIGIEFYLKRKSFVGQIVRY